MYKSYGYIVSTRNNGQFFTKTLLKIIHRSVGKRWLVWLAACAEWVVHEKNGLGRRKNAMCDCWKVATRT
jgi:hypothetical protein